MDLEDLFPFIATSVQGCPAPTMLHHLRQAAITFCERTLVWQQDLDPITAAADTASYAMVLPTGSTLVKLLGFTIDGQEAHVVTPDTGRGLVLHDSGRDVAWTEDRATLRVHPTPAEDGAVYVVRAALKPTQAATTIQDRIGEHYAADLAHGALASLFDMAGVPWADAVRASQRRDQFHQRIGVVAAQVAKGFSRGAQRVRAFHF